MKKIPLFNYGLGLFIILLATALTYAAPRQDNKPISVSLSIQEWQEVFDIIDNAAIPGEKRKPLLNKIATQIQAQMPKADSSKKKQ